MNVHEAQMQIEFHGKTQTVGKSFERVKNCEKLKNQTLKALIDERVKDREERFERTA